MNILSQHHPDDNLLTEFATGSLPHAHAIAISAHLHYCPRCANKVKLFESIGGALFNTSPSNAISTPHNKESDEQLFEQLMKQIHSAPTHTPQQTRDRAKQKKNDDLPALVRKMIDDHPLRWKRINSHLKSASLVSGQQTFGVSLQKIQAGGIAPEHNHRGTEMTIVLKGSFSDEDGVYHTGDFLLKQKGDIHRPRASRNEDCLCLSIEEAPVKLTSLFGRALNPFLRIHAV